MFVNQTKQVAPSENESLNFRIITPSLNHTITYRKAYRLLFIWWLYHQLKIFFNNLFTVVVYLEEEKVVHRTCVFPGFYKFPFMGKADIQLGDIYTEDNHRRKGIAKDYILSLEKFQGATIWYVVEETNINSIRLAEGLGFKFSLAVNKQKRLGLSFLGSYVAC